MRRFLGRFSDPDSFDQARSSVDCITTMVGFKVFGTHSELRRRRWRMAVVRFKTLFQTGIGQMAIADENTQATGIQKRDVDIAVGPAAAREDAG